jgi:hypothetical protein
MLSDFMQGLNNTSKHYNKNEYLPMHILFSTIYLLQKHRLKYRNYSVQEIIMEILYKLLSMVCTCMQTLKI